MNITSFADYLREKKADKFRTDRDVATYLGTKPAQLAKWRNEGKELTNREMAGMFERSRSAATNEANRTIIKPVVEFYPINRVESRQGMQWELFPTGTNASSQAQGLRGVLDNVKGIYIFYDTRGRGLYVGKTSRRTLWAEMKSAFNRDRGRNELFRAKHPVTNREFVSATDRPRKIEQVSVPLADLAAYFSAYEIAPGMIDSIEAVLIRAFANDLLNVRMETF